MLRLVLSWNAGCPGRAKNDPPPRLRKSTPLLTRDQRVRDPQHTCGGARQGRDSTRRSLLPFPGPPTPTLWGPRGSQSRPRTNFSRSPKARRTGAIDVPVEKWARSPSCDRSIASQSPPRSGGRAARVPNPASPPSPLRSGTRQVAPGFRRRRKEKWKLSAAPGRSPRPLGPASASLLPLVLSSLPACPRGPAPVTHLSAGAGRSGRARRKALPHVAPPMAS